MQNENEAESPLLPPDRPGLIHLGRDSQGRLLVIPSNPDCQQPSLIQPFVFPRVPLSLHCWLTGLGNEFQSRHDRCLAALLVLNCRQQRWIAPLIPSQSCGRDGSAWTLDLGDQHLPPDHRIGGSFQMRVARDFMDAAATVPQFDGFHIVQTLVGRKSMAYCFLHVADETSVVPVEEAMEDDWAFALIEATPRMTLE